MIRMRFYLSIVLLAMILTIPTACTSDSEESAENLAKKFCDCEKETNTDKKEACIDRVMDQVSFHINDPLFMAAFTEASKTCF